MEKGYLYVGHYIDTEGNYILKVLIKIQIKKYLTNMNLVNTIVL